MAGKKWYDKYLPFVAQSPDMQVAWLANRLEKLGDQKGDLSRDEIKPYIKLLLDSNDPPEGEEEALSSGRLTELLKGLGGKKIVLLVECAEIYEIPKLIKILPEMSKKLAIIALKKVPPPYEQSPLLAMDKVFHAIKERSVELLEAAAEGVLASEDAPENFRENYERYKEIMIDEHVLSMLYPRAR